MFKQIAYTAILFLIFFGMIAGSIPILSMWMPAYLAYVMPQAIAIFYVAINMYKDNSWYLALAFLVFIGLMVSTSLNLNRSRKNEIELTLRNRELIEDLNNEISDKVEIQKELEENKAEYERKKNLLPQNATSQRSVESARASYEVSLQQKIAAEAGLRQAQSELAQSQANLAEAQAQLGAIGDANSQVRASLAAVRQAELDLEFTQVKAPVDGYVTNVLLQLGSQMVANQPQLALVDMNSFWIDGYFRETLISEIEPGDQAVITLMSYPDKPLEGRVDSIGWGIAPDDGTTGWLDRLHEADREQVAEAVPRLIDAREGDYLLQVNGVEVGTDKPVRLPAGRHLDAGIAQRLHITIKYVDPVNPEH